MTSKGHALAREELVRALTAYTGIATEDGLANGTTIVDVALIGKNDFVTEKTILIMTGDAAYEDRGALSFDNTTGTITVASAFKDNAGAAAQIKKGTLYRVLNISTVEIDVENINTKIGTNTDAAGTTTVFARLRQIVDNYLAGGDLPGIKTQTDKLAGSEADTQVTGKDLTAVGGGTSGEDGADILTITTTTRKKVHMLIVSMKNCQAAATITVRMYTKVNGTFEKFYDQSFTQGTDPDAIMAINGTLAILADLRVEMHSSDAGDNAVTIPYSYILEDME